MSLLKVTSPHASGQSRVSAVMRDVLLATVPGVLVLTGYFGPGTLINIILGGLVAVAIEYAVVAMRGRDPRVAVSDLSILVTSTLLCIALPPYAPWWLIVIGVLTSVLLGKQVFGGLGYNPFNPAMVGYVVLLISFPVQMSAWAPPRGLAEVPGLGDTLRHVFAPTTIDAVTAVSGSGPAYFFLMIENLINSGIRLGLTPDVARELVIQTAKGAAGMVELSDVGPDVLRQRVTSPGGTTQAALEVFQEGDFADLLDRALIAAHDRAGELSKDAS